MSPLYLLAQTHLSSYSLGMWNHSSFICCEKCSVAVLTGHSGFLGSTGGMCLPLDQPVRTAVLATLVVQTAIASATLLLQTRPSANTTTATATATTATATTATATTRVNVSSQLHSISSSIYTSSSSSAQTSKSAPINVFPSITTSPYYNEYTPIYNQQAPIQTQQARATILSAITALAPKQVLSSGS